MRHWKYLLVAPVLALAAFNAVACYTVYDRHDRVVYQSERPPVDMSRPLHETLMPGAHMIFDTAASCPVLSSVASGNGGRNLATTSPLLTDERTARAMHLPHRQLGGGIALVQPRDAVMPPGVTVLPADATVLAGRRAVRGDTVITEWRDPPMTTVEAIDRSRDATRSMGAGPAPRR